MSSSKSSGSGKPGGPQRRFAGSDAAGTLAGLLMLVQRKVLAPAGNGCVTGQHEGDGATMCRLSAVAAAAAVGGAPAKLVSGWAPRPAHSPPPAQQGPWTARGRLRCLLAGCTVNHR